MMGGGARLALVETSPWEPATTGFAPHPMGGHMKRWAPIDTKEGISSWPEHLRPSFKGTS